MENPTPPNFLTVQHVAAELGLTKDGVYKLIRRGKLKAVRQSERKMFISRLALDAYRRRHLEGRVPNVHRPGFERSLDELRQQFAEQADATPEEWLQAWKADRIPETEETARLTMQALAIRNGLVAEAALVQPVASDD